jgi:hypothetical protein
MISSLSKGNWLCADAVPSKPRSTHDASRNGHLANVMKSPYPPGVI